MKQYISVIFTFICLSSVSLSAQDTTSEASPDPEEQAQSPALADPAEHVARQNAEIAKSPQTTNKALAEMQKRARLVAQRNVQFMQDVKDAKAIPFAELSQRYINEFPMHLNAFKARHDEILNKPNLSPAKRKELVLALQEALRVVGPYMNSADYENEDMTLTKAQVTEFERLRRLDPRTQIGSAELPELKAVSHFQTFTMQHIPVYLRAKAQPGAVVYFSTGGGGQFENGLPMQSVTANKKGIAETSWVSKGSATGLCNITATSPSASSPVTFKVEVVGLSLRALPKLVGVRPTPDAIKKTAEALQQSAKLPSKPSQKAQSAPASK